MTDTAFAWSRSAASGAYQAPEAFLCVLSLAAAADASMAALESQWLQHMTRRWSERGVIRERDIGALHAAVCARLGAGGDIALSAACAALPAVCRLPVFAQALDLMLCNGPLAPREEAFALTLSRALELDEAEARRIHDCIVLKNAY